MHGIDADEALGPSSPDACPRPTLVCFSHLRWGFVTQRPQHLMRRAARTFRVVFVEEPWCEGDAAVMRVFDDDGIAIAVPHLPEGTPPERWDEAVGRLVRALLDGCAGPRVFWYYTPAAVAFSRALPRALTVYDNMDELSAFHGADPGLLARETELLARADLVFTGGRSLYEAKRHRHDQVRCLPSSVDVPHFARARTPLPEPDDQRAIPRPRLGFFGVIDERMDLPFLDAVAALRPDWHFVMLGPVTKIDEAALPRRANIHWLGMKDYAVLPAYLGGWSAAIMPFALNEATRFISPTKTPEFLAGGLPVVSTAVADVVRDYGEAGLVAIAATPAEAVASAERWMRVPPPGWLDRVDAALARTSWDRTWATMEALILAGLPGAVAPARGIGRGAAAS